LSPSKATPPGRMNILEICLARDPSQMFDIMHLTASDASPAGPPLSRQPSWCVCANCREMSSDLERKCCGLPHMEAYILQEGVLHLARRIWTDIRAVPDAVEAGKSNRQFRYTLKNKGASKDKKVLLWHREAPLFLRVYAAYRQFGHRVVIPSCCVWTIRDRFPDPHGQYQGYLCRSAM
uniref:P2X purinoreceptor 7 intracellular domain-containing protein n=1 Tax=Sinocyclocheilus rhinocerous TaxID=307959 RepID=A0A673LFX2_9TELE